MIIGWITRITNLYCKSRTYLGLGGVLFNMLDVYRRHGKELPLNENHFLALMTSS